MSLTHAIWEAYYLKQQRKWDKIYFAIDLHGTIIVPGRLIKLQVYPQAKEGLQFLSKDPGIALILFTSTQVTMLKDFYEWCTLNQVTFNYLNENPECDENSHIGDYTKKFYYNVLLDDRAGFNYKADWYTVIHAVETFRNHKFK